MQERHDLPTAANIIRGEGGPGSGSGGDLLLYGPCYGGGVGCIGGYIGKAGSGSGGTSCCLPQVRHSHSAGTGLVCVKGSAGCHCACPPPWRSRPRRTVTGNSWQRPCTLWAHWRRRPCWRKFLVDRMEKSLYNAMNDNGIRIVESCAFSGFDADTEDGKDRAL